MYTVFEVQISGALDPAKSDAYSRAVQMTTPQRHDGNPTAAILADGVEKGAQPELGDGVA